MSNTLVNGIKIAYPYGIAGRIRICEQAPEDYVVGEVDFYLLRLFSRKTEDLTGFKHLDYEGALDPETGEDEVILNFARERAPTDKGEIEKLKRAVEIVKRMLGLEQTEKWYVEDNDDLDDGTVPENLEPPPRFT